MAFFNKQSEYTAHPYAKQAQERSPAEPLLIIIEYIDGSEEKIELNYNLNELTHLFSTVMETGSGLNFLDFNPPMTINPRHIKKVYFFKR